MNSFIDRRRKLPTLDQMSVFLTVVDEKGFAAAARHLNRQQSVISYSIAAMEAQLGGVELFDRSKRRPVLTEVGRAVLVDARRIVQEMDGLAARVDGLLSGVEPELRLVVDALLPASWVVAVLKELREEFPSLLISLRIELLGGVPLSVLSGETDIGISGPLFNRIDGLDHTYIGKTRLLPVASPDHPLSYKEDAIRSSEAQRHTQVVLSDNSKLSAGRDFSVLATETIRVSDLRAKHYLILAGLGWGNLPEPLISEDIAAGNLKRLRLAEWEERPYPFHSVYKAGHPVRPAAACFIARLGALLNRSER